MTEEAKIAEVDLDGKSFLVGDYVANDAGSVIGAASAPFGTLQASVDGGETWIDVDATWDGKGSLDEHRQKEFAKIKQPGFGNLGKANSDGK